MTSLNTFTREAAVLIALRGTGEDEQILLTQRAAHLSMHSGEVAFPGGMRESQDVTLHDTALREAHEEVGLHPELVEVVGQLPQAATRSGVRVTPVVGRVPRDVSLVACLDELESYFWVPTAFFLEDQRLRTDLFDSVSGRQWAPVYSYLGYTIWGFTARVLVEYVNRYWGAALGLEHEAPRAVYGQQVRK